MLGSIYSPGSIWRQSNPFAMEARTLFAAMTTPPTDARKIVINSLIVSLKTSGIWSQLDVLYLMAAADAQAAGLNWKNPGSQTLSPQNAPTFTADRGYQGDGATSYILTGYTPSTFGGQMTQNNASIWFWSRTSGQGAGLETDIGESVLFIVARSNVDTLRFRVNDGTTSPVANTDGSGLIGVSRAAAGVKKAWRNGVQVGADQSVASTALMAVELSLCGGPSNFSLRQEAMGAAGASLAGLESAFYTAINNYMVAVGAA